MNEISELCLKYYMYGGTAHNDSNSASKGHPDTHPVTEHGTSFFIRILS
jgi:hypothetical protein